MGARRRSRRDEELFAVAAVDPELHQQLVEMRRTHPAGFRKELARLVREGVIPAGRTISVSPELLALVAWPVGRALAELAEAQRRGELTARVLTALLQEERRGRARPPVLAWLERALEQAP